MVAVGAASDTTPLIVASALVSALLFTSGRREQALWWLTVVIVAAVGNRLLKEIFDRPRPAVRPIPESVSRYSYPSGHAANSLAFVVAFLLVFPTRTRRVAAITAGSVVAILVGFSRLVIGAHYPSDVLAAWLWVGAWLTLMSSLR